MNEGKYKVTFRVETKRGTFYYSKTEVVAKEDLPEAQGIIEDVLVRENSFIAVLEEGGDVVYIPREEIAAVTVYKQEAEDE